MQIASHGEIVLISPDEKWRRALGQVVGEVHGGMVREFTAYPSSAVLATPELAGAVVIVEVDSDITAGLELVENISQNNAGSTVMVFSASDAPGLLVRCMRAGAREFLGLENLAANLREALARAAARRAEIEERKKVRGRLLVFWGAKGGVGVTTLASNFAIALRKESGGPVALVDLNLQLGGVAVLLGIKPRFTLLDALRNPGRVDREFVSTLMTQENSGLAVLPSADEYVPSVQIGNGTVNKVVEILREQHSYIVVDAGPGLGHSTEVLFGSADTTYVVTQLDIPSLRNAQRFIAHRKRLRDPVLEVVLNRFEPRKLEYDEERITKAIGLAPRWKVPNDYAAVRRSQNTGLPLASGDSPVARSLLVMARAACGKPVVEGKRSRLGFLGL